MVERYIREARSADEFSELKTSLEKGQNQAGLMTREGILINGNTRAVAIREFQDPQKKSIRVAVLPETINPKELALAELHFQMQKELKKEYSFTNELLFIEELANKGSLSHDQIARELRLEGWENSKKGAEEVSLRLRLLDLIRLMQKIPREPLKLTSFDPLKYQQLKELYRTYSVLMEEDQEKARQHLVTFLLVVMTGVDSVHQLRKVDPELLSIYVAPRLEENEDLAPVADYLLRPEGNVSAPSSEGGRALLDDTGVGQREVFPAQRLIDMLAQRDKRVQLSGDDGAMRVVIEQQTLKEALNQAVIAGIEIKKMTGRAENRLDAPVAAVRNARTELEKCKKAVMTVENDPEFDVKRRKALESSFNKLRRVQRDLESRLEKLNIISRS